MASSGVMLVPGSFTVDLAAYRAREAAVKAGMAGIVDGTLKTDEDRDALRRIQDEYNPITKVTPEVGEREAMRRRRFMLSLQVEIALSDASESILNIWTDARGDLVEFVALAEERNEPDSECLEALKQHAEQTKLLKRYELMLELSRPVKKACEALLNLARQDLTKNAADIARAEGFMETKKHLENVGA